VHGAVWAVEHSVRGNPCGTCCSDHEEVQGNKRHDMWVVVAASSWKTLKFLNTIHHLPSTTLSSRV
jgi:hypothetical protein